MNIMTLHQAKERFRQLFHDTDPEALAVVFAALEQFEAFKRVYDESILIMSEQMQELSQLRTHSLTMTRAVTELRAKLRERDNADADPYPEVPVLKMQRKDIDDDVNTSSLTQALKRADTLCPPRSDGKEIAFVPTMTSPKKLERLNAQTAFFMGTLARQVRLQQTALEHMHRIVLAAHSWVERRDSPEPTYDVVNALLVQLLEIWGPE